MRIGVVVAALLAVGCAYHSPAAPTPATVVSSNAPASIAILAASRTDRRLDVVANVQTADRRAATTDDRGEAKTILSASDTALVTASAGSLEATVRLVIAPAGNVDDPVVPPGASGPASLGLMASPIVVRLGDAISFFAVGVGLDQFPVFTWDYGDGQTATSTSESTSHTYATVGHYIVTVSGRAANTGRVGLARTAVDVTPAAMIQLQLVMPKFAHVNAVHSFTVGANDGTPIQTYSWDFGDGSTFTTDGGTNRTNVTLEHAYTSIGPKVVTVIGYGPNGRTGIAAAEILIIP